MTMNLTESDIQRLIQMGYSRDEVMQAAQEFSTNQIPGLVAANTPEMSNTLVSGSNSSDNLIKWQLELDSILERIEHILRGDKPTMLNGNLYFAPPKTDEERLFNDSGVSEIMRILSMYLNRNTILSNYDEDTIKWKVLDFGKELSDLIFLKYQALGLNTLEKRKRYPMIVREIVDTVHSSFLRALNGGERDSLRQARQIHQTESFGQPMSNMGGMNKERSVLNPLRYLSGKYGRGFY